MSANDLLRISDVAAEYHVSEETVRRWIRSGRVPYEMAGPFRVRRSAIETMAALVLNEPPPTATGPTVPVGDPESGVLTPGADYVVTTDGDLIPIAPGDPVALAAPMGDPIATDAQPADVVIEPKRDDPKSKGSKPKDSKGPHVNKPRFG